MIKMARFQPLNLDVLQPRQGASRFSSFTPPSSNVSPGNIIPRLGKGTDTEGFGGIGKGSGLIPGLDVLSGLVGAYTGLKQFGLEEEAFKFNKQLTQRNLSNQARITNQAIKDRLKAAAIQRGGSGSAENVAAEQLKARRVQGTL